MEVTLHPGAEHGINEAATCYLRAASPVLSAHELRWITPEVVDADLVAQPDGSQSR